VTAVARVVPDDGEAGEGGDEEGDGSSPDAQLELTEEE
jgi:hypothetical protein